MSEIDELLESVKADFDAMETAEDRKNAAQEFLDAYSSTDDAERTKGIAQVLKEKAKEQDPELVIAMHKLASNFADVLEDRGLADFSAYKAAEVEKFQKLEDFLKSYGVDAAANRDWTQLKEATGKMLTIFEKLQDVPDDKYDDLDTMVAVVKTAFPDRTGNPLKRNTPRPGA